MNIDNKNGNKIAGLAVVTILLITAMTVTALNQDSICSQTQQ
ncbi:MAG: hypothetical protein ACTHKP_14860 [Nitrososphaeraceae archaeon]